MQLALASVVFLGSEPLGTRDHILLSQIWDFRFRRSYDSQGHGGSIRPRLHTGLVIIQIYVFLKYIVFIENWLEYFYCLTQTLIWNQMTPAIVN
jgi:hypothetical protein